MLKFLETRHEHATVGIKIEVDVIRIPFDGLWCALERKAIYATSVYPAEGRSDRSRRIRRYQNFWKRLVDQWETKRSGGGRLDTSRIRWRIFFLVFPLSCTEFELLVLFILFRTAQGSCTWKCMLFYSSSIRGEIKIFSKYAFVNISVNKLLLYVAHS